jgi:hypothetical protein
MADALASMKGGAFERRDHRHRGQGIPQPLQASMKGGAFERRDLRGPVLRVTEDADEGGAGGADVGMC